jgi:hypothetical protein
MEIFISISKKHFDANKQPIGAKKYIPSKNSPFIEYYVLIDENSHEKSAPSLNKP